MAGIDKDLNVMDSNVSGVRARKKREIEKKESHWVQGNSSVTVELYTYDQRESNSCFEVKKSSLVLLNHQVGEIESGSLSCCL